MQVKISIFVFFLHKVFMGSLELISYFSVEYDLYFWHMQFLNCQKHGPTCRRDSALNTFWYFPVQFLNYSSIFNDICILINCGGGPDRQ